MAVAYCLHGFLGQPSDWDILDGALPIELRKVDLFQVCSPAAGASMSDWAKAFNAQVIAEGAQPPRFLIGYSMGGRLALHALIDNPGLWDAAILISTNPGLSDGDAQARSDRRARDEQWARRFETETWDALLAAWNAQPVFRWQGGAKPAGLERAEAKLSRPELAGALRSWSSGAHADLSSALADLPMPIAWLVGEEDRKYVEQAKQLASPALHKQIIARAAHRLPWENGPAFLASFSGFLSPLLLVGSPEPEPKT